MSTDPNLKSDSDSSSACSQARLAMQAAAAESNMDAALLGCQACDCSCMCLTNSDPAPHLHSAASCHTALKQPSAARRCCKRAAPEKFWAAELLTSQHTLPGAVSAILRFNALDIIIHAVDKAASLVVPLELAA